MHLSPATLQDLLATWGYLAVFAFVAIETMGIPFPGETMLIAGAVYAGTGHLRIPFVILAAILGAITGDNTGYWIGRTGGRELVLRYGKYIRVGPERLAAAERFFNRYGDKTVFFGRFVALLRIWTPFLAGLNELPWPKFLIFDTSGAICWATIYGVLAFYLGKNLPLLERVVRDLGIGGIVLAVLLVVGFLVYRWRMARRVEQAVTGDDEQTAT